MQPRGMTLATAGEFLAGLASFSASLRQKAKQLRLQVEGSRAT